LGVQLFDDLLPISVFNSSCSITQATTTTQEKKTNKQPSRSQKLSHTILVTPPQNKSNSVNDGRQITGWFLAFRC